MAAAAVFFLLLFVVLPALIFLVSMWEKPRERPLVPADADAAQGNSDTLNRIIADATARGFALLGVFSDGDKGFQQGIVRLLLSPDRAILVKTLYMKVSSRCLMISQLPGDRWIITCDLVGTKDLSGLHAEEMLPGANFAAMLLYHRQRLEAQPEPVGPFPANGLPEPLHRHGLLRYQTMQAAGLVSPVRDFSATWVYTARGAAQLAGAQIRTMFAMNRARELSNAKQAEADLAERSFPQPPVAGPADGGAAEDAIAL